jgi:hypothetical protein|eukprot:6830363-Prymnesium_polylepis.1
MWLSERAQHTFCARKRTYYPPFGSGLRCTSSKLVITHSIRVSQDRYRYRLQPYSVHDPATASQTALSRLEIARAAKTEHVSTSLSSTSLGLQPPHSPHNHLHSSSLSGVVKGAAQLLAHGADVALFVPIAAATAARRDGVPLDGTVAVVAVVCRGSETVLRRLLRRLR